MASMKCWLNTWLCVYQVGRYRPWTTYGFYPVWAGLYDSPLVEAPLGPDFRDMSESPRVVARDRTGEPQRTDRYGFVRAEIESLVTSKMIGW